MRRREDLEVASDLIRGCTGGVDDPAAPKYDRERHSQFEKFWSSPRNYFWVFEEIQAEKQLLAALRQLKKTFPLSTEATSSESVECDLVAQCVNESKSVSLFLLVEVDDQSIFGGEGCGDDETAAFEGHPTRHSQFLSGFRWLGQIQHAH